MFRLLWMIYLTALMSGIGYISYRNHIHPSTIWSVILILSSLLCPWWLVTRMSNNVMLDSVIYDVVTVIASTLAFGLFSGAVSNLSFINIIGMSFRLIKFHSQFHPCDVVPLIKTKQNHFFSSSSAWAIALAISSAEIFNSTAIFA